MSLKNKPVFKLDQRVVTIFETRSFAEQPESTFKHREFIFKPHPTKEKMMAIESYEPDGLQYFEKKAAVLFANRFDKNIQ